MTPRKELFLKVKEALSNIRELELVDLERGQFRKNTLPTQFTAALIKINAIKWESMVEQKQEGQGSIEIQLYCKDGWMQQFNGTNDPEGGLIEIDLIDKIVEQLQGLTGDYFKPLQQSEDEPGDDLDEVMNYKIKFDTTLYRRILPKYTMKKLTSE